MSRIAAAALTIATVLLVGACSSPESAPAPAPAPPETVEEAPRPDAEPADPAAATCVLLEGVDVSGLLAEEAGAPEERNGTCWIKPVDTTSPASLVLQVVSGPNGAIYYQRDRDLLGVSSEVADLGDEAYVTGRRVNVLVSGTYVYLQVLRNPVAGAGQADDAALVGATATVLANGGW